jgi:hypothetical protein
MVASGEFDLFLDFQIDHRTRLNIISQDRVLLDALDAMFDLEPATNPAIQAFIAFPQPPLVGPEETFQHDVNLVHTEVLDHTALKGSSPGWLVAYTLRFSEEEHDPRELAVSLK